jgi:farnesyl-diphosphate farnesyltransferase
MRSSAGRVAEEIPGLLRANARTMAPTLGILPRPLREPLGLAYLLARASDTIADSGSMPRGERISRLEGLAAGECPEEWVETTPPSFSRSEAELLGSLPGLLSLLGEHPDCDEITGLWRQILEGQLFDLRRFAPGSAPLAHAELEHYCDLVAGSVGRTWTRLIARHAPCVLLVPAAELLSPASEYGKGLQLLNILRDREADRAAGRHYLEEGALAEPLEQAREWLAAGEQYLRALRPGRILMASALPLDLARATLPLVASAPPGTRAKLSRPEVGRTIAAGLLSLVLPRRRDPV